MQSIKTAAVLLIFVSSVLDLSQAIGKQLIERHLTPKKEIDHKCLEKLHNENATLMERCEFFKCFEERFPCGKDYWIMNWGYKYCRRYANPTFIANFTQTGKELLDAVNKCLPKKFEKFYRKTTCRCRRLFNEAFDEQAKCYLEIKDKFCKGFNENKILFVKVLDYADIMMPDAISMIKKAASGCKPKIDLLSMIS